MYRYIKARMVADGISGKQMVALLAEQGILCTQPDISRALSSDLRYSAYPQGSRIREAILNILDRLEAK